MLKMIDSHESKTFKEQTNILINLNDTIEFSSENKFNLNDEISNETLTAYLQWKFPDREHNENRKWASLLLSDLKSAGIRNYNQIEKVVNDNLTWLSSFEKDNPPSNSVNHRFSDIGALRIILTEKFYP